MRAAADHRLTATSRGRRRPSLCDHRGSPVVVDAISDGYIARCLACDTLGPVRETSEAARLELLAESDSSR